jgi:hypothetical protein
MPPHPATVPNPVLELGQFNRALAGYSCRAQKGPGAALIAGSAVGGRTARGPGDHGAGYPAADASALEGNQIFRPVKYLAGRALRGRRQRAKKALFLKANTGCYTRVFPCSTPLKNK